MFYKAGQLSQAVWELKKVDFCYPAAGGMGGGHAGHVAGAGQGQAGWEL